LADDAEKRPEGQRARRQPEIEFVVHGFTPDISYLNNETNSTDYPSPLGCGARLTFGPDQTKLLLFAHSSVETISVDYEYIGCESQSFTFD
jgi:hypothetical protein